MEQVGDLIETTLTGQAISATKSSFDLCERCGQRRCHAGRKWCAPCIRRRQRALPADRLDRQDFRIDDACPDWHSVVPERFWPAEMAHLPEVLVKRVEALPEDRGLFFWGAQGSGKTYAVAAALKHLWASGFDIAWQSFEELLLRVRDTYKAGGGSEWGIIQPLCEVDVLALDDVGVTVSADRQESDFSLRTFMVLLDHRLAHCRRTFVTSNRSVEDFRRTFDARIASRICQACDVVKIHGNDRRLARASRHGRGTNAKTV